MKGINMKKFNDIASIDLPQIKDANIMKTQTLEDVQIPQMNASSFTFPKYNKITKEHVEQLIHNLQALSPKEIDALDNRVKTLNLPTFNTNADNAPFKDVAIKLDENNPETQQNILKAAKHLILGLTALQSVLIPAIKNTKNSDCKKTKLPSKDNTNCR